MKPTQYPFPANNSGRAGQFLAQSMKEALALQSFESFRLQSLDISSRIREMIDLLDQASSGRIKFSTVAPAREELFNTLRSDDALENVTDRAITFALSELGKRTSNKPADIEFTKTRLLHLGRSVSQKYQSEIEKLLLKNFDDLRRKSYILSLIHQYLSFLVNSGFSREYISHCVDSVFLSKQFKIFNRNTLKSFLAKFQSGKRDYVVILPISEGAHALLKSLDVGFIEALAGTELTQHARHVLRRHPAHSDSDLYIKVKLQQRDEFAAIRFSQELVRSLTSLSDLQWDGFDVRLKNHGYVSTGDRFTGTIRTLDDEIFRNRITKVSGGRANRLKEGTKNVITYFDTNSIARVLSANGYVSLARNSTNANNQIMLMWSAVEILFGDPPGTGSRIGHFIDHFVPATCLDYQKRYLSAVFYRLRRHHRKQLDSAIDLCGVPSDVTQKARFIRLVFDPAFASKHGILTSAFAGNEAALYHLNNVYEKFKDPKAMLNSLSKHEQRVQWQIYRLYRTRNQLVHGGDTYNFVNSLTLNAFEYYISSFFTIIETAINDEKRQSEIDRVISEATFRYLHFKNLLSNLNLSIEDDLNLFLKTFQTRNVTVLK